LSVFENNFDKN